jgi:lipopolysaccharide export system permease protein
VNILDRHISKAVLATALGAVGLFAFILTAGNIIRDLLGPLIAGQLPFLAFWKLVLLTIPYVVAYALPLGMLTAVLLTLGRLSSDSEITAMRASGMSIARIAKPVLILAALGFIVGIRVNFESMPWAKIQYERDLAQLLRANPFSYIRQKTFIRDFPGYVIYIGSKEEGSKDGSDIRDIWIWFLDAERRTYRFVRAESGHVDYDSASNQFIVTLKNAREEEHDRKAPDEFLQEAPRISTVGSIEPLHLSLERFSRGGTVHQKADWMTYAQLAAERSRLDAQSVPPAELKAHEQERMKVSLTIQNKINMALAIFSFAFIGVPLGIKVSRRETSANLGVAVILALTYYFLVVAIGWLDRHPGYRPDILVWLPNVAVLALGFWLLNRLDRA